VSRVVVSVLPRCASARAFCNLIPIPLLVPTSSLAWSPSGRLRSRRPKRRCRFYSCAVAGLSPDSITNAPKLCLEASFDYSGLLVNPFLYLLGSPYGTLHSVAVITGLDGQGSRREGRPAACGSGEQQRAERVERRRSAAVSSSEQRERDMRSRRGSRRQRQKRRFYQEADKTRRHDKTRSDETRQTSVGIASRCVGCSPYVYGVIWICAYV
jgi:hypothetical protein